MTNGQNMYGGYPGYQMNPYTGQQGYNYMQPHRKAAMTQPVTEEEKRILRQDAGFSLAVTATDKIKAKCTHKNGDNFAFIPSEDGSKMMCEICGAEWSAEILPDVEVQKAVDLVIDILQQTKAMYLDIPAATAEQFFMIIPLLEKVPTLYKLAHNNFASHDSVTPVAPIYGQSGFNQYQALFSGVPMYGYNGYQQPAPVYGGYNYQQPAAYPGAPQPGVPYGQPTMATAPVVGENPFGYGQPSAPMVPPVNPILPTAAPQMPTQNPVVPQAPAPAAPVAPASPQAAPTEGASKTFDV